MIKSMIYLMEKIDESILNNMKISYYKGFNIDDVMNHPHDGSKGMMVVFFNSKIENIRHNRNITINDILDRESQMIDFFDMIHNIDNPYVSLYETHGYDDVIFKIIKNKLECIKDHNFKNSEMIWNISNI